MGESQGGSSRYDTPLVAGTWRLDASFQYRPLTNLVHGSDLVSLEELGQRSPAAAEHGDANFYVQRYELKPRYAWTDRTEVFAVLPYQNLMLRVDNEDQHHRNQTKAGVGDIRLGVKHFFRSQAKEQAALSFGLSLPTGSLSKITAASYLDHEEAAVLGIPVPEHSHLQLGTGTVDPWVGAEMLYRTMGATMYWGGFSAQLPFYDNRYGYRTAPQANLSAGPAWSFGKQGIYLGAFAEVQYAGRDQFHGSDLTGPGGTFSGRLGVPNTGRIQLSVQPTLTWAATESLTLTVQARLPLWTKIREDADQGDVQLTETASVFVGLSYRF